MSRMLLLSGVAAATIAGAGIALACASYTLSCSERTSTTGNTIVITNLMPSLATIPANSWIYWKRSGGGDGKITTTAEIGYKGTLNVARPVGATSACSAYYITP